MTALRVVVVDDELLARQRLLRLLAAMPDVEIAGEHDRGDAALADRRAADVVLLDIEMPGLLGTEVLARWPDDGPAVIFCTAHPEHALAAFDGGAIDYLLKPVDAPRLQLALERVRGRRPIAASSARFTVTSGHGIVWLEPADITSLTLDGELVTIETRGGRYFSAEPLGELHARLPANAFARVHRRAVVNLDHVVRFDALVTGGALARMTGGRVITVSRQAARELRRRWRTA